MRFAGDPVVLVVADTRRAEGAAEFVEIDYEPLPAVIDYTEAEHADVLVHEGTAQRDRQAQRPAGLGAGGRVRVGANVAHETIFQQAYAPVPMEGRGLVVDFARASGDLTICAATQTPHEMRLFCSRLLGIPSTTSASS